MGASFMEVVLTSVVLSVPVTSEQRQMQEEALRRLDSTD
jgi:hypothetical protein